MANEDDAKACRFSDMIIPKRLCGGPVNSRLAISYALNDVLDNACYWTDSREFAGFFSNNRLLAIWNEYPELREKIDSIKMSDGGFSHLLPQIIIGFLEPLQDLCDGAGETQWTIKDQINIAIKELKD